MGLQYVPDAQRTKHLTTEELRAGFLVQGLFEPGKITLRHIDLDRVVLGSAVPLAAPLELEAPASLAAEYFTERREIGILNIGGVGAVTVDGTHHEMAPGDALYVGRGSRRVSLASHDAGRAGRY